MIEVNIKEVFSVVPYSPEWATNSNLDFLCVKMTTEYNGTVENVRKVFTVREWDIIQKQGYYLISMNCN